MEGTGGSTCTGTCTCTCTCTWTGTGGSLDLLVSLYLYLYLLPVTCYLLPVTVVDDFRLAGRNPVKAEQTVAKPNLSLIGQRRSHPPTPLELGVSELPTASLQPTVHTACSPQPTACSTSHPVADFATCSMQSTQLAVPTEPSACSLQFVTYSTQPAACRLTACCLYTCIQ